VDLAGIGFVLGGTEETVLGGLRRARAKVSSKPWDWAKAHEIGCGYPVGENAISSSPTCSKPRQQVRNEPACTIVRGCTEPGVVRRQAA